MRYVNVPILLRLMNRCFYRERKKQLLVKNTLQCAKEQKAEYPGGGSGGNKANKEIQNCKVFEAAVTF